MNYLFNGRKGRLEDMGVRREIFIMKFNNKKKTLAAQPY
jgi:hypothetical protein